MMCEGVMGGDGDGGLEAVEELEAFDQGEEPVGRAREGAAAASRGAGLVGVVPGWADRRLME